VLQFLFFTTDYIENEWGAVEQLGSDQAPAMIHACRSHTLNLNPAHFPTLKSEKCL